MNQRSSDLSRRLRCRSRIDTPLVCYFCAKVPYLFLFCIVFFIDLLKHYNAVLPPTIVRKKRESEKQLPIRKRTALVDQRINRRSVDAKALLEVRGQQITNRPRNETPTSPTKLPLVPPPPPIIPTVPPKVPPVPPAPAAKNDGVPPRPKFASPPPEDHGVPPRPKFASPPPENDEIPTASSASAKEQVVVAPATPQRVQSPAIPSPARSSTPDAPGAGDEDKPVAGAGAGLGSLHRSGSGEASRVRGPRVGVTRGPRGPAGPASPAVSSPIHTRTGSIGRSSISNIEGLKRSSGKVSPVPAADPRNYAPKKHGGKATAGAFSKDNGER